MLDFITQLFFVVCATAVMHRAFQEILLDGHPVVNRVTWIILMPMYVLTVITTLVKMLLPSIPEWTSFLWTFSTLTFIYSAVLHALYILLVRRAKPVNVSLEQ